MKRLFCFVILFFLITSGTTAIELPSVNFSGLAAVELQQVLDDVSAEISLHHEVNGSEKEQISSKVKLKCELHFRKQGYRVTWPWLGFDYHYTKEWDFYTLETHLDYKDANDKYHKPKVYAELFPFEGVFEVVFLRIGDTEVVNQRNRIPEVLLLAGGPRTLNMRTGIDLSALSYTQLKELAESVNKEIELNHKPKSDIQNKVHSLVKTLVEDHYSKQEIKVSWPWFDYSYTNDWGCYTETTRISYKDASGKKHDKGVYAEAFYENDKYDIFYLKIGYEVLFDRREELKNPASLHFFNSRDYLYALDLEVEGKDEEALVIWQKLGDFENSSSRLSATQERINKEKYDIASKTMRSGQYEKAQSLFEELKDYRDSAEKALECENIVMKRKYNAAIQLIETEQYELAITALEALDGYEDSVDLIAKCRKEIQKRDYQAAIQLNESKEYEKALNAFLLLGDFEDSAVQVQHIQTAIKERDYLAAQDLMSAFQYEKAFSAFKALGDYLDSDMKALECETAIAGIDRTLKLSETEVSLFPKSKYILKPVAEPTKPEAPTKTQFLFTSSDEKVAKVGKDGAILGASPGETLITFIAKDNPYVGGRLLVKVLIPVTKLGMSEQKMTLQLSSVNSSLASGTLKVDITPSNASDTKVEWRSSNEKVATVTQNGEVKAVGIGKATITAISRGKPGDPVKTTCAVTVTQAVDSISIEQTGDGFYVGRLTTLKAIMKPANAASKKVTWTSSNNAVATVTKDGKVKGIAPGTATITATSTSGINQSLTIKVETPPTTLRVSASARILYNNHVGRRWTKTYRVDDIDFTSNAKIYVHPGQTVKVFAWITENDKNPETGGLTWTIEITDEIIKKGITYHDTVYVTENNGRYSGYDAEWEVTIRISR